MTTETARRTPPSVTQQDPPCLARYVGTRERTGRLTETLTVEDQAVQAADFASPTKWHLAHTTWFFETFILIPNAPHYRVFSDEFQYCFNSYYETVGERQPRHQRGLMTRPSLGQVWDYREHVDDAIAMWLRETPNPSSEIRALLELGCQHEQQHQELLVTDILALFASQPLRPAYLIDRGQQSSEETTAVPLEFLEFEEGLRTIGYSDSEFCFDNERPAHQVWMQPFRIANRLTTNREWLDFIEDGGYQRAEFWLSEGWDWVRQHHIEAPGYWEMREGKWHQATPYGLLPVPLERPVSHLSHFEADAFAKWSGRRLPTEMEWEHAARTLADPTICQPTLAIPEMGLPQISQPDHQSPFLQAYQHLWQWTQSAYLPYPGYQCPSGAVGEYNGKFMSSQIVLRGSSLATAPGHQRLTYRNFFYPGQRWQFTGMRLAEDR